MPLVPPYFRRLCRIVIKLHELQLNTLSLILVSNGIPNNTIIIIISGVPPISYLTDICNTDFFKLVNIVDTDTDTDNYQLIIYNGFVNLYIHKNLMANKFNYVKLWKFRDSFSTERTPHYLLLYVHVYVEQTIFS